MRRQPPPQQMFERSSNYRANFLKHRKGFFGIYTCAYCGKLVSKHNMEVDHVFPVHAARTSIKGRAFVLMNSVLSNPLHASEGVNGVWNMVAACKSCNRSKSDSGGVWIFRGYIGRRVYPIINLIMLINIIVGLYKCFTGDTFSLIKAFGILLLYRFISFVIWRILK